MHSAIPTHIITGFLGSGKTTAILEMLEQKPADERWAILVNEFGEIGMDAAIFNNVADNLNPIQIKEVPGGCMCCTAGLPMQVALNQLLKQANPDRLIIEPSGLGHPKEVLQTLKGEHYAEVLDVQTTITLVDARKINDSRYTQHDIFRQQIQVADIIIANKSDLYDQKALKTLEHFVQTLHNNTIKVIPATHGKFPKSLLNKPPKEQDDNEQKSKPDTLFSLVRSTASTKLFNQTNVSNRYKSISYSFTNNQLFSLKKLKAFLTNLKAERVKAIMKTDNGDFVFNLCDNEFDMTALKNSAEGSKIEIIFLPEQEHKQENLKQQLCACLP